MPNLPTPDRPFSDPPDPVSQLDELLGQHDEVFACFDEVERLGWLVDSSAADLREAERVHHEAVARQAAIVDQLSMVVAQIGGSS